MEQFSFRKVTGFALLRYTIVLKDNVPFFIQSEVKQN